MKSKWIVGTLLALASGLPLHASAADEACMTCAEPAYDALAAEYITAEPVQAVDTITVVAGRDANSAQGCGNSLVKSAEDLNDKVKPLRDLVGYVRSPQGLAIKLVNDHIVKIPAWVGYAMDPVGSIKHRAIDEVRSRAREAMSSSSECASAPSADAAIDATKVIAEPDQSI